MGSMNIEHNIVLKWNLKITQTFENEEFSQ